jgi:hypothetical protein
MDDKQDTKRSYRQSLPRKEAGMKHEKRQIVVDFLSNLPEFSESSKSRIEQVSRSLLKTLEWPSPGLD